MITDPALLSLERYVASKFGKSSVKMPPTKMMDLIKRLETSEMLNEAYRRGDKEAIAKFEESWLYWVRIPLNLPSPIPRPYYYNNFINKLIDRIDKGWFR